MSVRIRYFAAAKAALGVGEQRREAAGRSIDAVMREIGEEAPDAAAVTAVLDRCSFILNRHATTDRATLLADGDELDVLPPFAGG